MKRKGWLKKGLIFAIALGTVQCQARAQGAEQKVEPELMQHAQTIHIPITAIHRDTLQPVGDLKESDLSLKIDDETRSFQLSRPWSETLNPKTGKAEDQPNLLVILPAYGSQDRKQVLEQAIQSLNSEPDGGWNISILDDSGVQSPYTRDRKAAIADLKVIENTEPQDIDLNDWRLTASLAIASMRNLPGRRVVLTLGNIFHIVVVDQGEVVYEAFAIDDVASAARNAGAVIYVADSAEEIEALRGLAPRYSLAGSGPWLLVSQDNHMLAWITGSIADTMPAIRRDAAGQYDLDVHLDQKQLDGQLHVISATIHRAGTILNVPPYYIAPNLARLQLFSSLSEPLRKALLSPPSADFSPLQLVTQLAYFPHPDGKSGTQIATTGFFWNKSSTPPRDLNSVLQLEQTSSGFITNTTIANLKWSETQPVWSLPLTVSPGAYRLRVAATDPSGKIVAGSDTSFTVQPTENEPVRISSLVLSKTCVFSPPVNTSGGPAPEDYLQAGNCDLQPDTTHSYSPQDIVWTLVRITPVGDMAKRSPKDWKGRFVFTDAKGSKLVEEKIEWLPTPDGSLVGTAAFPLSNPKLKLVNGEYAIAFRLKGPGMEREYEADAPFLVYGVQASSATR